MDFSKLSPAVINQVAASVDDYINSNRKKYLARATPLSAAQLALLQPFFPPAILAGVRIYHLQGSRVQDPSFYGMLKMMGFRNLPDFSGMAAITFVDVIVSHEEFTDSLLFHELVHVAQYAQLGTREFILRYIKGFLDGGSYENIPLEKNAYELEARFSQDKSKVFSVADEVQQWLAAGKL